MTHFKCRPILFGSFAKYGPFYWALLLNAVYHTVQSYLGLFSGIWTILLGSFAECGLSCGPVFFGAVFRNMAYLIGLFCEMRSIVRSSLTWVPFPECGSSSRALLHNAVYRIGLVCSAFPQHAAALISRLLKNYRSLLQKIVSFIGLFCKRDLSFEGAY